MESKELPPAHAEPAPLVAQYPLKAGYTTASLFSLLFVRIPFSSLYYLRKPFRPNPTWSFKQAMMVSLIKFYHTLAPAIRLQLTAPATPGGDGGVKELFDLIEPVPVESLRGILSPEKTALRPVERPGSWYPALYDKEQDSDKKIVLYFFGGAYVIGDFKPGSYTGILNKLQTAIGDVKFLSVGYRLASAKGNHFPAALIDGLSAYRHLLKKGVKPSRIILMGDSAGANLALALIRYLSENPDPEVPLPAAAILACPWIDLTPNANNILQHHNYKYEMITQDLLDWGVRALVPPGVPVDDPYISPGLHPFNISLPIWIDANEDEALYDSIKKFATGLQALPANDVELHVGKGGTHDTFMWGTLLGFDAIVDESVASVKGFLEKRGF